MRYASLKKNDIANAPGVCVSLYTQGCPHHCYNCFNKETWDFNGGKEFTYETLYEILEALTKDDVKRNLCILGGEPLCPENQFLTQLVINTVKEKLPDIKVYIWTGYVFEELFKLNNPNRIKQILKNTDFIIDGPFIEAEKELNLKMRGSTNQRIIDLSEINLDDY